MAAIHQSSPQSCGKTCPESRRILLIAPSPPPYGGMAIQARLLEKLLSQEGHSVVFFASNRSFPRWLGRLEKVRYLRTLIRGMLVSAALWDQVRWAEVVHVLAASWVYFFIVVYPAVLFARTRGKRVVLNYRGGDAKQFFRYFGWMARPVFKLASVVTTPSEFLARVIREHFPVVVRIVPNILESATIQYRRRTAIEPRMLVTRHLEKIYGIEVVLRAFREVQRHYPEASLWIAGTGSQEEHLRGLVAVWNLQNVQFLGYVAHSELGAVYLRCDILLNASFVDNFPGSLLEASGAGLVVVSTDAGGIPFMFQNRKNALLVQRGDWNALALAAMEVLQSPSLAAALTERAANLAKGCLWPEVRKSTYAAYGFPVEESS